MTPIEWKSGAELGDSTDEVEKNLATLLRSWMQDFPYEPIDTYIKIPSHKYRAVSALQKAIRRGDTKTALRMANALHGLDWEYVWRRLAVIALEDIGVADVPLVCATIWVCGKKQWRNSNGGCLQYLHMLVHRMAAGVKDRSVIDLVCWADWGPDLDGNRAYWFNMPDSESQELIGQVSQTETMHDTSQVLVNRMLAAWSMVGTKRARGEHVPENQEGSMHTFMKSWQAGPCKLPPAVEMMCMMSLNKIGDAMPIAYPLIWQMAQTSFMKLALTPGQHFGMHWELDVKYVQLPKLGSYPSESFDQHCREGKKAIRMFNTICKPAHEYLLEDCKLAALDDPATFIAEAFRRTSILVFRVEGAQVDKRLVFDGSRDLFDIAELALNWSQGNPGELNDYAMDLVRENMATLHWCRRHVLDMIPAGSGEEAPNWVYVGKPFQTTETMPYLPPADGTMVIGEVAAQLTEDLGLSPEAFAPAPDGTYKPGVPLELDVANFLGMKVVDPPGHAPSGMVFVDPTGMTSQEIFEKTKAGTLGLWNLKLESVHSSADAGFPYIACDQDMIDAWAHKMADDTMDYINEHGGKPKVPMLTFDPGYMTDTIAVHHIGADGKTTAAIIDKTMLSSSKDDAFPAILNSLSDQLGVAVSELVGPIQAMMAPENLEPGLKGIGAVLQGMNALATPSQTKKKLVIKKKSA